MKYYKVVDSKRGHRGLFYKEGRNIDPLPFNPSGNCRKGGIYFAREDIFAFWDYGDEIYEVTPISEIYENPGRIKKWKCKIVDLKYIGKTNELKTVRHLVEDGADINIDDDYILYSTSAKGYLRIVKYLVEKGANIHAVDDCSLCSASTNGYLDVVKYLVEQGADIHADDDDALRLASVNGHLKVVKYLVEQGADIHFNDDEALRLASKKDHLYVVEFLKSCE